jgi:hypothetical protein
VTGKMGTYPFKSLESCGIVIGGRMAEWSIAAVLKTAGPNPPRGFESLSFRLKQWQQSLVAFSLVFLYCVRENYLHTFIYLHLKSRSSEEVNRRGTHRTGPAGRGGSGALLL